MTIQQKHVSVNAAAFASARFLGGLQDLSPESTVVLFRLMVMHETVNPKSEPGRELIKAGFVAPFGNLKHWVTDYLGDAIKLLVAEAGADLLPQDRPTSITELGHRLVKGRSKPSRRVRAAEAIMRSTAFRINPQVLALASCDVTLSREDRLVLAVIHAGLLPEEFYFPISYDYRGRMYYRGGIITPQGSDLLKGLLQFSEARPIGKHGRFALSMALADAAKITGSKVAVMRTVRETLLAPIAQGSNGFLAAALACELLALDRWVAEGNAEEDFMSRAICHMDATCSGLQIAAAVTGHRPTAEATNCTASKPSEQKRDIYRLVAEDIANAPCALAQHARRFGRDLLKKPVMTLGYGAGKETLKTAVKEFLGERGVKFTWDDASEQYFFDCITQHCGASIYLKQALQQVVPKVKADEDIEWTTHDGFHVVQEKKAGWEVAIGSFRMQFDVEWDADLNTTALPPNFVHSLDAAQMREAVRMLNCPVACIHDSLGVHAGNYVAAAKCVRIAFHTIEAPRITREFLASYGVGWSQLGGYDPEEALESSYFWC
jgi:DNA-directed RNA polymerase